MELIVKLRIILLLIYITKCYNTERGYNMIKKLWIACPKCQGKMFMVREDTKLVNFPGYCKKCKTESVVTIEPKSRLIKSM